MSSAGVFWDTLKATGFIIGDKPAPGLVLDDKKITAGGLGADAIWEDRSNLKVLFKFQDGSADEATIASWHRDAWNLGLAPLLWIISPTRVQLYNAYERPASRQDARAHLLKTFNLVEHELAKLDDYAGRLAMASGRFWANETRVSRDGRVDIQLLNDLQEVEKRLSSDKLARQFAQSLLGRSIFARYLIDRQIVKVDVLSKFGADTLSGIFGSHESAYRFFDWMRTTFNGDMFPVNDRERTAVKQKHLKLISETLAGTNPVTGQMSLWAYKFDVIPIELISSIYEQFAHSFDGDDAHGDGLHYTPVSLVHLILDEIMRGTASDARVLDLTCGSGVFLVEAFRRLVTEKAGAKPITRSIIRDTLREQIFGVDKNEAAIRVASFSLYLAALELDPDPSPPEALRFDPLIGRNLFVADAFEIASVREAKKPFSKPFDIIVGNPPWTFRGGKPSKPVWPNGLSEQPLPPRSQDFAFVWHSLNFASDQTKFGVVLRATPFFSNAAASIRARNALLKTLQPIALVNLAALRDDLFPTADYPAMVLFARLAHAKKGMKVPVVTIPWTSAFAASGTFEIGPSDVRLVSKTDVDDSQVGLKLLCLATPRDRLLLRRMQGSFVSLTEWLSGIGASLATGIQPLAGDRKDASSLLGLPYLAAGELTYRINVRDLPAFDLKRIHRPRNRDAFEAPLVLLGEGMSLGRASVGVSAKDLVYTRSFYGISLAKSDAKLATYIAGLIASSLTSWQLLMTAAEFGVHKRKLLKQDLDSLLVPPAVNLESPSVAAVRDAYSALCKANTPEGLLALDSAVFELYGLEPEERLVAHEGLERARREYVGPRASSDQPASINDLKSYAKAFVRVLNAWQRALGRTEYSAEILAVRASAPLRVVRFAKAQGQKTSVTDIDEDLNEVLVKIGARIKLPIAERLAAMRELRIHAGDEVLMVKPAARRFWTAGTGLNDADAALGDGLAGDNDPV